MNASPLVTSGIPSLAVAVIATIAFAIRRYAPSERRRGHTVVYVAVMAAWLAITGVLAERGFFADTEAMPPRPILFVIPTLGLAVALALSRVGQTLGERAPLAFLVGATRSGSRSSW